MSCGTDVLIFVEDPGAANYIAPLPAELAQKGWQVSLLAGGNARNYLLARGVHSEEVQHPATAGSILATYHPRLVLVGTSENPDTLGLALVAQARRLEIPSVGVVDFYSNAGQRFRGQSREALTYAPDWLLLPDEWTRAAYVDLGYPAQRTAVCGHPHYDHILQVKSQLDRKDPAILRRSILPQSPEGRPVVVFVAEVSTGLNPQQYLRSPEYTLTGWGTSVGRTEIVLEEFLDAIRLVAPRPYLVLRLHPKNALEDFAPYLCEFDHVSSGGSPLELVYVSDLVVGMTSMLLFEATLLGCQTLSIVPREVEKEWLPSIHMHITTCVTTREQLRSKMTALVDDGAKGTHRGVYPIIAEALPRVVAFITTILKHEAVSRSEQKEIEP